MSAFQDDLRNSFLPRYGAVAQIIVANVGIYLLLGALGIGLLIVGQGAWFRVLFQEFLAMPSGAWELLTKPWTLVTHGFIHNYPGMGGGFFAILHIVFNMLWVFWMGRLLREYLGDRHVWGVHLFGILAGAVLFLLLFNLSPAFSGHRGYLFGASAGVSAIVVGTATLLPNFRVMMFFFGTVQLKWLALIFVVIDFLMIMGNNPGGSIAHLGGAMMGLVYITSLRRGNDFSKPFANAYLWAMEVLRPKPKPRMKVQPGGLTAVSRVRVAQTKASGTAASSSKSASTAPNPNRKPTQEDIDRILDKIQEKGGYDKLSQEEKQMLFRFSQDSDS